MTGKSPYEGLWWRFERYELRDGLICPAPGAKLEQYSPWDGFNMASPSRSEEPYQRFLGLIDDLKFEPEANGSVRPTADSEARLLAWCSEFGLLGVLVHEAIHVSLAPRWRPSNFIKGARGELALSPDARTFSRVGGGWQPYGVQFKSEPFNVVVDDAALLDVLVDPLDAGDTPSPHVILQNIENGLVFKERLNERWSEFFPGVPNGEEETFDYPTPLTVEFWRSYAEPLKDFLRAGIALKRAIVSAMPPHIEGGETDSLLSPLLSPIAPTVVPDDNGAPQMVWLCKTLLSSLAMMASIELTSGVKFDRCLVCQRFFTSKSLRGAYCSARCRQTAQKRAYRLRQSSKDQQANG